MTNWMGNFQEPLGDEGLTLGDLVDFLKENKLVYVPTYSGNVRVPEGYEDVPVVVVTEATGDGSNRFIPMIAEDESALYLVPQKG